MLGENCPEIAFSVAPLNRAAGCTFAFRATRLNLLCVSPRFVDVTLGHVHGNIGHHIRGDGCVVDDAEGSEGGVIVIGKEDGCALNGISSLSVETVVQNVPDGHGNLLVVRVTGSGL